MPDAALPADTTIFSASSTGILVRIISSSLVICGKPEVGFGEVGMKILKILFVAIFQPLVS